MYPLDCLLDGFPRGRHDRGIPGGGESPGRLLSCIEIFLMVSPSCEEFHDANEILFPIVRNFC